MIKRIAFLVLPLFCINGFAQQATSPMMDHSHLPIEVPDTTPIPQLSLSIYPDVMGGYNLTLDTQNYHFIPPPNKQLGMAELMAATIDANSGYVEGHAHLYLNGVKIQRVYGHNLYLPPTLFKPGVNQLTISLNNHGHMYWLANKKQVLASLFFKDDGVPTLIYKFESFPIESE